MWFRSMWTRRWSKLFVINGRFKVDYGCGMLFCEEKDCIGSEQNKYCFAVDRAADSDAIAGSAILT